MKISVITVCLNSERTIEKTLQSVCNQDYKNKIKVSTKTIPYFSLRNFVDIFSNYFIRKWKQDKENMLSMEICYIVMKIICIHLLLTKNYAPLIHLKVISHLVMMMHKAQGHN